MATATTKKLSPAVAASTEKKLTVVKKSPTAVKKTIASKAVVSEKPAPRSKANGKAVELKTPVAKAAATVTKAAPETVEKVKKAKLVRDSFTMPESEYAALGAVKKACLKAGVEVKKSQLLRIGVALLSKTDVPNLKKLIAGLAPLKAGRPKKEK